MEKSKWGASCSSCGKEEEHLNLDVDEYGVVVWKCNECLNKSEETKEE